MVEHLSRQTQSFLSVSFPTQYNTCIRIDLSQLKSRPLRPIPTRFGYFSTSSGSWRSITIHEPRENETDDQVHVTGTFEPPSIGLPYPTYHIACLMCWCCGSNPDRTRIEPEYFRLDVGLLLKQNYRWRAGYTAITCACAEAWVRQRFRHFAIVCSILLKLNSKAYSQELRHIRGRGWLEMVSSPWSSESDC